MSPPDEIQVPGPRPGAEPLPAGDGADGASGLHGPAACGQGHLCRAGGGPSSAGSEGLACVCRFSTGAFRGWLARSLHLLAHMRVTARRSQAACPARPRPSPEREPRSLGEQARGKPQLWKFHGPQPSAPGIVSEFASRAAKSHEECGLRNRFGKRGTSWRGCR